MRIKSLAVLLLGSSLALFPGVAASTTAEPAVPLCDLLSNADKYDGQDVTVRAVYRLVIHGSVLMSPNCRETYVNMRQVSDYSADKHASKVLRSAIRRNEFQPVEVVVRGTFRSAKQGQCFGQNCFRYELEVRGLLSAAELKKGDISNQQHH